MKYIESPHQIYNQNDTNRLFIAGGITGCPDWQQEFANSFIDTDFTILNPRRADYPKGDPNAELEQITWEHNMLKHAHVISFWFPKESVCPIVLYELGAWSVQDKPIVIGVENRYSRYRDVKIQTQLIRPEIEIVDNLGDLADQVKEIMHSMIRTATVRNTTSKRK